MTVIDNGSLMTAYLQWRGVPPSYLGASRGVGAVFGMGGTFLFPLVTGCFGGRFRQTGLVAVWLFWLLLLPSALSFLWYGESRISDYSVIGCMIISRVGLWMFDLAETQVMQEDVEPRHRATLNSVQTSLFQASDTSETLPTHLLESCADAPCCPAPRPHPDHLPTGS